MDLARPWEQQTPEALPPWSEPNASCRAYSWSSDGRKLAGYQVRGDGVFVSSLESRQFERLSGFGPNPRWLSDNHKRTLYLVDFWTKRVREVLSLSRILPARASPSPATIA